MVTETTTYWINKNNQVVVWGLWTKSIEKFNVLNRVNHMLMWWYELFLYGIHDHNRKKCDVIICYYLATCNIDSNWTHVNHLASIVIL